MMQEASVAEEREVPVMRVAAAKSAPQRILSGLAFRLAEARMRWRILQLVWKLYGGHAKTCIRVLKTLDANRRRVLGPHHLTKFAVADGRYYFDLYTPGFPSKAFDDYIEAEAARLVPVSKPTNRFTNVFLAITKKCTLQCEHCFEWDALNGKEQLSTGDLHAMMHTFQAKGVSQIQISGGEPMLRYADILGLLRAAKGGTDFWLLTSGYRLDAARAAALKAAGLRGVAISLDHYDPEMHNAFRGFRNAYAWVEEAVGASLAAGLTVALTICTTRAFVNEDSLMAYATLAKRLGVSFIQILEPKATGHYAGKDVALSVAQEQTLEDFYLRMNYDVACRSYPIVTYHGYHQRQVGCFGAANRHVYVDTDGDMHACPFCRHKSGSALGDGLDAGLCALQSGGCHDFKGAGF